MLLHMVRLEHQLLLGLTKKPQTLSHIPLCFQNGVQFKSQEDPDKFKVDERRSKLN